MTDTSVLEHVDLENLLVDALECCYIGCTSEPEWRAVTRCCGAEYLFCDLHKKANDAHESSSSLLLCSECAAIHAGFILVWHQI